MSCGNDETICKNAFNFTCSFADKNGVIWESQANFGISQSKFVSQAYLVITTLSIVGYCLLALVIQCNKEL